MYQTKNMGLNITEMPKDTNMAFSFHTDLGYNFEAIDNLALSHRNISNCVLEVANHIKYELIDGVLTIKSGSIIAVPYGTEDLTAQYPVGSTFIHDNYKVVDTSFTNNKFFVLVELQIDSKISIGNSGKRTILLNYSGQATDSNYNLIFSGDTAEETLVSMRWYDTSSNYIKECLNINEGFVTGTFLSLPLMIVTADSNNLITSIDNVFNGFGYIGSTVFALPGIKCLMPNGRNEDGTLNNIEYTTNQVITRSDTGNLTIFYALTPDGTLAAVNANRYIIGGEKPVSLADGWWFDTFNNIFYKVDANGNLEQVDRVPIAEVTFFNDNITSFQPKFPFKAVDYNDYSTKIAELESKIETLQAAVKALQG